MSDHVPCMWERLAAVFQLEEAGREALFESCDLLTALRNDCSSDRAFGVALAEHGCDALSKNERAARIQFGQLPEGLRVELRARYDEAPSLRSLFAMADRDGFPSRETSPQHPANAESSKNPPEKPVQNDPPIPETSKSEPTRKPRSASGKLADDVAQTFASAVPGNMRRVVNRLADNSKARGFLAFWAKQLQSGAARPVPDSNRISALTLVDGLDRSFREHCLVYDGNTFSLKYAKQLEAEFITLLAASQNALTLHQYLDQVRQAASAGVPLVVKPPPSYDINSLRVPESVAKGTLPESAVLADGTRLKPQPIIVCGQRLFPNDYRPLPYATAFVWATVVWQDILPPLFSLKRSHEECGLKIATLGTHVIAREWKDVGLFLSEIGTAIRKRGKDFPPEQWFDMERVLGKTVEK